MAVGQCPKLLQILERPVIVHSGSPPLNLPFLLPCVFVLATAFVKKKTKKKLLNI